MSRYIHVQISLNTPDFLIIKIQIRLTRVVSQAIIINICNQVGSTTPEFQIIKESGQIHFSRATGYHIEIYDQVGSNIHDLKIIEIQIKWTRFVPQKKC